MQFPGRALYPIDDLQQPLGYGASAQAKLFADIDLWDRIQKIQLCDAGVLYPKGRFLDRRLPF